MIIAENPKIIIRSLKKGNATTVPFTASTCFLASILLKKINNKKQMLQMKVTFEKNEIIFIQKCFEKTVNKIILICRNYFLDGKCT
jgi:hypothetical protein